MEQGPPPGHPVSPVATAIGTPGRVDRWGSDLDGVSGLVPPIGLAPLALGIASCIHYREAKHMGTAKNKTKAATGAVKEKVGKATKNRSLEAKGKKDKAAGNLKQAGRNAKKAL